MDFLVADLSVRVRVRDMSWACYIMLLAHGAQDVPWSGAICTMGTYNILANFCRKSRNKAVWMPKDAEAAARDVQKATKLIPSDFSAVPALGSVVLTDMVLDVVCRHAD